ncbi:MAG: DNA-binding protein [Candidatus Marinimicrobia bacterium]|nr:DNA-binding protein [Candidatus Neomarinimicrobiota bacterium]MBL7023357.1 DNA-binding protein [Candidatus Neomarinimicrobiota bacterium]MBL7109316.1 DNA-binding protein [Candidatus Neomarinimicrobiota bacterium]
MKYKIDDDKIFVKLVRGDWINKSLTKIAEDNNLTSGWISGIGAIENIELGYYDFDSKSYIKKSFDGEFELIGYNANISLKDSEVFIHSHATIGDINFKVFGGHLYDAKISAAGEFLIQKGKIVINRTIDKNIGLALWEIL